ncbi:phage holin family protein [Streptomyces sp. TRM66268-LWL]|uniref:Phage holin family protein n=1 Tax=Streptomyces polyasparticus TaxID=2767826 RepID=A0ABR7SLF6_9ACTN|nr:phage holin family protein [Streptomyces polyasparticus]MBC9715769.1 phage holin family protein [Streptomyces polyasparticus]
MADISGRRKLGALIGVCIAGAVLPGITLGEESVDVAMSLLVATAVIVVLTQLIYVGPTARVPAPMLLAFGLAGFVQDALIWWLLSWMGEKVAEMQVEGFGTILLAGLITRATILAVSLIPAQSAADVTT